MSHTQVPRAVTQTRLGPVGAARFNEVADEASPAVFPSDRVWHKLYLAAAKSAFIGCFAAAVTRSMTRVSPSVNPPAPRGSNSHFDAVDRPRLFKMSIATLGGVGEDWTMFQAGTRNRGLR
jgi:hypothetical protein